MKEPTHRAKILFAVSTDNKYNLLNIKCLIEYILESKDSIAKMRNHSIK